MSSLPSNRSSTLFILGSAPCTRIKKATEAAEQEPAIPLLAANPVIPDNFQLPRSCYLDILVEVDKTLFIRNFLAGLFTWLLLAGYVVFPGAFTLLHNTHAVNELGELGKTVLTAAQKKALGLAAACCICRASGIGWLWRKCHANYIWLVYYLFLQVVISSTFEAWLLTVLRPDLRNSLVGLINSLVNIYTAQDGFWSVTAIVTTTVTGTCLVVMFVLYLVYKIYYSEARKEHDQERSHLSEQGV
jgi:hypothetical protein